MKMHLQNGADRTKCTSGCIVHMCDQTSYEHQPEPFCPPKGNKLSSSPHFFGCQYVLHNPMNHLLVLLDAELSGGGGGGGSVYLWQCVFVCRR